MALVKRVLLLAIIAAVAGIGVAAYLRVTAPTKEEYVARGNARVRDNQLAEAIIEYLNAVQIDPTYADARFQLAETYLKRGQLVPAMNEYIRAADLQPSNTVAQLSAIKLLLLGRRFEDARQRANVVLARDPKNVEAQIAKATATARIVDLENGLFELQNAIAMDPSDPRSQILVGAAETGRGNLEEAEAAFKKAVEIAPRSVSALHALASFYYKLGRLKDTETYLRRAIDVDPKQPESHRRLATLLVSTNRAKEAEAPLKTVADATNALAAHLALADYYFSQRRDAEALAVLERSARTREGFVPSKLRLARMLYVMRRQDDAHKAVSDVLGREPGNTDALILRSQFLLAENNSVGALKAAEDAVAGAPGSAIARTVLGEAYSYRSQTEMAIQAFSEAIRLNPVFEPAKLRLLQLELQRGNIRRAEELATETLREAPYNVAPRLARAQVNAAKGATDLALRDLNTIIFNYPNMALAHARMGEVYLRRRDQARAQAAFEKATAADPLQIDALRGRVALAFLAKKPEEAVMLLNARLRQTPEDPDVLMLAARTYAVAGDQERQESALQQLISVQPGNLPALVELANLYVTQNKLDAARARYEELASGPMAVGAQTMLGLIYQTQNKPLEARAVYERLLAARPDTAVAANNLAWIYSETGGNLDTAMQLAQDAVRMQPGSPDFNDTLGWIYLKKDLTAQAITSFETALKAQPTSGEFHYHLGLAYRKAKQLDKAINELRLALKYKPDLRDAQLALDAVLAEQAAAAKKK